MSEDEFQACGRPHEVAVRAHLIFEARMKRLYSMTPMALLLFLTMTGCVSLHTSSQRVGRMVPSAPAGCDVRFENLTFLEAFARHEQVGQVTITGAKTDFPMGWEGKTRDLLWPKVCEMGGTIVVSNAMQGGENLVGGFGTRIIQFSVWIEKEGAARPTPSTRLRPPAPDVRTRPPHSAKTASTPPVRSSSNASANNEEYEDLLRRVRDLELQMAGQKTNRQLIADLNDPADDAWKRRREAARLLGQRKAEEALPALEKIVQSPATSLRLKTEVEKSILAIRAAR